MKQENIDEDFSFNRRRLNNFKLNKEVGILFGYLVFIVFISIFADFVANDKPLIIKYDNNLYFPIFVEYPETNFGGDFETEADYRDPYVIELIENKGW